MDRFLEQVYLREIESQATYALTTHARMETTLLAGATDAQEFFREAQAMLNHAGAVSRLLWPPRIADGQKRSRAEARGNELRKALGIVEPHVLQDRSLRNHLEHLDERLDDWAESSKNRIIGDQLIGPVGVIGGSVVKATEIIRHYDPSTSTFIFRGELFDMSQLLAGVGEVRRLAQSRLASLKVSTGGLTRP